MGTQYIYYAVKVNHNPMEGSVQRNEPREVYVLSLDL